TGNGGALVRSGRGMPQNHVYLLKADVEFFGHNLSQSRTYARSQIDMTIEGQHFTFGQHGNENIVVRLLIVGSNARLTRRGFGRLTGRTRNKQGTRASEQGLKLFFGL